VTGTDPLSEALQRRTRVVAWPGPPPLDLIESAADVLCWRDYLDPDEDEIPVEVIEELTRLWHEGPCDACPGWGSADALADHFLGRKQQEYERSLPSWQCDCGAVYKTLTGWMNAEGFYATTDDGMFGDLVGIVKRDSKGRVKHSDTCPGCGQPFAETIAPRSDAQRSDPQMRLF
jgi:hypothetical protein